MPLLRPHAPTRQGSPSAVTARNRRLYYLQTVLRPAGYFDLPALQKRDPVLYHDMYGQYESAEQRHTPFPAQVSLVDRMYYDIDQQIAHDAVAEHYEQSPSSGPVGIAGSATREKDTAVDPATGATVVLPPMGKLYHHEVQDKAGWPYEPKAGVEEDRDNYEEEEDDEDKEDDESDGGMAVDTVAQPQRPAHAPRSVRMASKPVRRLPLAPPPSTNVFPRALDCPAETLVAAPNSHPPTDEVDQNGPPDGVLSPLNVQDMALLEDEMVDVFMQRFLAGQDTEFDYQRVDRNADYDDPRLVNADCEDSYFDSEEPN
ncbi:hypothetical protein IWQ60_009811 [Tieghemiomyces parasiticus]|uniref:CCD97-like C-terminal domain-containing protein n=1 Tax=Tieghemiomyces parasiticus TaxID=78921 RepID=A0A9W7ZWF7_9FUNG|nr:hypothetical protein IWQ60_009811 [Tieghemiomyces parasiticus]